MIKTKILALSALTLLSCASFSFAATFSFSSTNDTLIKGCPTAIDVMIDTQGQETTAAEMVLVTNDQFDFNGFDATLGVFPTYTQPQKDDGGLNIGGTTASTVGYNGVGKFGTLTVTPKGDTVTLAFFMKPDFAGADSNIFLKGTEKDLLTSAESKTFKIVEGTCPVAAQAAADVKTTDDVTVATQTPELRGVLEEVTSKNEAIVLPKTAWTLPSYAIYVVAGLIVLLILFLLLRKKKVNK